MTDKSFKRQLKKIRKRIRKTGKATRFTVAGVVVLLVVSGLLLLLVEREPDFGPLPDFASIEDVSRMKAAFFDYLRPIVSYQNQQIEQQRAELMRLGEVLEQQGRLGSGDKRDLKKLAQDYAVEWTADDLLQVYRALKLKVDVIPMPLALVQAAKESGWGRSRFAKQGNNLFGEWCFKPGCGIVPVNRAPGKSHEVADFDSVNSAVRNYMQNLNTHPKYSVFRRLRADMRDRGEELEASSLAAGLIYYSERREAYVKEIRMMIRQFHKFEAARAQS